VFYCDSQTTVRAIERRASRSPAMMHLLRTLTLAACRFHFDYRCSHIAGADNTAADLLSRFGDCQQFRALSPRADASPTPPAAVPLPTAADDA